MVFAISDIHGHYEQLMDILAQNNVYDHLKNGGKLVFLGDYIDRGHKAFKCYLICMNCKKNGELKK